jgi:poly(A) polymerase
VAPERVFYELRRLVVSPEVLRGLALIDEAELMRSLLPELEALKGVEQNPYHHLDVWGHTVAVLESWIEMEEDLERAFGAQADGVAAELARPLGDELTRGQALRFAALFHDIGKPRTRRVAGDGRILFWGHDRLGAEMTRDVCRRLRTSAALSDFLAKITHHHLRLGFLVHERPLSPRQVFRYLRACEPVELEVTVLSAADRLATRGERTRPQAIEDHIALARQLVGEALAWRSGGGPPRLPLGGDELAAELGIERGPRLGELLELLREETFAGELSSREEAIARARRELEAAT